jgi:hypothetical protein
MRRRHGGIGVQSEHIEIAVTRNELADRFGLLVDADERYPRHLAWPLPLLTGVGGEGKGPVEGHERFVDGRSVRCGPGPVVHEICQQ